MTVYWEARKDYDAKARKKAASEGAALSDGSFPIYDQADADNAWKLRGHGKASEATVVAHIKKRVKALGLKMPGSDQRSQKRRGRRAASNRHREVRFVDRNVELRQASEDGDGRAVLHGMVIKYGVPYTVRDAYGEFTETIERGAAEGVLQSSPDVRFLFNHDGIPLARTMSGSLTLRDLAEGVQVEARLNPEMPSAQDVICAVRDGLITGMSVGMVVGDDEWNEQMDRRSISRLSGMPDVSAVTYPASPTTSLEAVQRSLDADPELRAQLADDVLPSARLDHIAAEVRAGKVLSNANASVLVGMAQQLHDLLASGGCDFDHQAVGDDGGNDADTDAVVHMEDGTEGPATDTDGSSEMLPRSEDQDAELRRLMAEQMLAEHELLKLEAR